MIAQQHPRMDPPSRHRAHFSQCLHKLFTVLFIEKNRFPAIAARHHMIECSPEFNTNAPRHELRLSSNSICQDLHTDPYSDALGVRDTSEEFGATSAKRTRARL